MKNKLKGLPALFCLSLVTMILFLSRHCIINQIVGMPGFMFTGFDALMPLTGAIGLGFSGFLFSIRTLIKFILHGQSPLLLIYHIPGLCAAVSWATSRKLITGGIPFICIVLFLMHPVGFASWLYTFYWFIPIIFTFIPERSVFIQALLSTFVAHAVGSVICLYTIYTAPALWWALIPVVFFERLIFALMMTAVYHFSIVLGNIFSKNTINNSKVIH